MLGLVLAKHPCGTVLQTRFPVGDLVGVYIKLPSQLRQGLVSLQGGQGHLGLEGGCVVPAWDRQSLLIEIAIEGYRELYRQPEAAQKKGSSAEAQLERAAARTCASPVPTGRTPKAAFCASSLLHGIAMLDQNGVLSESAAEQEAFGVRGVIGMTRGFSGR